MSNQGMISSLQSLGIPVLEESDFFQLIGSSEMGASG